MGHIVGNLKASPSSIRMLPMKGKDDFTYTTRITHRSGKEFVLTNENVTLLRSSIPGVKATVETFQEGGTSGYTLTITGNTGNHRGAFRGTYAIKSGIEGEPPLRINFSGSVRR